MATRLALQRRLASTLEFAQPFNSFRPEQQPMVEQGSNSAKEARLHFGEPLPQNGVPTLVNPYQIGALSLITHSFRVPAGAD